MTDHHDPMDDQFAHREEGQGVTESFIASRTGHDDHGETTVVLGRTLPFPLYTVVFLTLGILTVIEVLLGGMGEGPLRVILLLALALVKAFLVVYYYMHLKTDSRVFAIVLIVPVFVAVVSLLFVLMSPPGN